MDKSFFTIGIGASAGGQQSLSEFFSNIATDINVAFVVVTHLLRDRRSILDLILTRHTFLPVIRVEEDMPIVPGNIYVMIEDTAIEVTHGWLKVKPRDQKAVNYSIDIFFNSLADDFQEKAIGIILSGGGKDGLEGSIWINQMGGKVMVEDPDSAKDKGMPTSIIKGDHPTVIMNPADLAKKVNAICKSR